MTTTSVLIWPGLFGLLVGIVPGKWGLGALGAGVAIYLFTFSTMSDKPGDGIAWGLYLGIFLLAPLLVGWLAGFVLRSAVKMFG